MTRATTNLGRTASQVVVVGKVAHGLMSMTWKPDEQCFEAIKAGIDALPSGAKMLLNGGESTTIISENVCSAGEFYGHNLSTTNLEMIARFFEKYPEYVDRTFLSIEGGLTVGAGPPLQSHRCSVPINSCLSRPENTLRSVNAVNEKLRGTKRLDLFQCARVDPNLPVEDSIAALAKLKSQGKLDHIEMSECSAETLLRRGHKVGHGIGFDRRAGNQTFFLGSSDERCSNRNQSILIRARNTIIATAKELGVAVAAYSPLGRGFLTGQIKKLEDLPADNYRRHFPRFQEDNLEHNLAIVDVLTEIAKRKNITTTQLCIGWVSSLGPHVIPLPGSSRADRTLENCSGGDVTFTETELQEIH
ncbi:NADP-dependent oxidoreductase domain-containing protein [Boletus reticuloceps]|uniref:NADP-dependent oxidoreductase domain-containing protein n=1 Tax=Boletus reticuloceps TaxID=495285 RepID=A0A8I3ABD7_9AGAM|nr:NADP-dependent oxidoreductase domain-containing protein [Boletus reticuloceps]